MGFFGNRPTISAALVIFIVWLAKFLITTIRHRQRFRYLRVEPGPPHHPVFGHLISLGKVTTKLPKCVHPHVFAHYLTKEYNLAPVFYLDLHPVNQSMLVVLDPDISHDVAAISGLPKHPSYHKHLAPMIGRENLLLSDGARWKQQRAMFNPGFSVQHLMNQIPSIVDIVEEYVRILDQRAAENKLFRLEEEATKVTVDVIGKVVLDHDFNSLTTQNAFIDAMRASMSWMPDTQSINPLHRKNPLRPVFFKYYKYRMDMYISKVLDERFRGRDPNPSQKARKKSSIDLALEAYFKESGQDVDSQVATMDTKFRRNAVDNMQLLLFAGHDTTASTICYSYHMLSKHPKALNRLRQEFDEVFGSGVNAAQQMRQDPYVINRCEYTLAVIKEVLRLWSPASTIRQGTKNYSMKDPATGIMLSTEGFIVWPVVSSIHRDTRNWGPDAMEFKPERFLPGNQYSESVNPNSFRPFEKGPRNCIGQELAMLELKIVLALTAREFDIRAAYDELESLRGDGSMWDVWLGSRSGPQKCYGDEMYQVLMASAKPREGMPARVRRRNTKTNN